MGEHLRRILLSLSAYEFQRGYWFGGVLVLMALFFSDAGTEANPAFLSEFFAFERIAWVAVAALLAPLVFTLLSELTFLCILRRGEVVHEPLGRFIQSATERTQSEETRKDGGGTTTAKEVSKKASYLVPVAPPSGGVKQIIACYGAKSFRSHFCGYLPYSVMVGPEKESDGFALLIKSRRGVVLAKEEDALDFDLIHKAFRLIRICEGCWILVRRVSADFSEGEW